MEFSKQRVEAGVATFHHTGNARKTIALAYEDIDEVDLNARVRSKVSNRARRADLSECDCPVVEHDESTLRRDVRCPIGSGRRNKPEALFLDDPLHVGR